MSDCLTLFNNNFNRVEVELSTEQIIELLGKQLQAQEAETQRHAQELQQRAQQHAEAQGSFPYRRQPACERRTLAHVPYASYV